MLKVKRKKKNPKGSSTICRRKHPMLTGWSSIVNIVQHNRVKC